MKESKDDAIYTLIPDSKGRRCADCVFFQQVPGTVDLAGTCARVNGIIDRDASCSNFSLSVPNRTRRRYEHKPKYD